MKIRAQHISMQYNEDGKPQIILTTSENRLQLQQQIVKLKQSIEKGKELSLDLKEYREKRSLDANSYFWVLCSKMAGMLRTSEDELYIELLKRYGQREPKLISVVADAVDIIYRATDNHCCVVGESELNGKTFKHVAILIGSSQYETRQMSILIDGAVGEAKDLGIEVMTPDEIARIKSEWGSEKEAS